jgi:hypothetical protein
MHGLLLQFRAVQLGCTSTAPHSGSPATYLLTPSLPPSPSPRRDGISRERYKADNYEFFTKKEVPAITSMADLAALQEVGLHLYGARFSPWILLC